PTASELHDWVQVGGETEEMHRQYAHGALGDGGLERRGSEVVRREVDVAEHRAGTHVLDDVGGGDPGVCGHEDLVSRTQAESGHDDVQSGRTRARRDGMRGGGEFRELPLELGDMRALDDPSRLERELDGS